MVMIGNPRQAPALAKGRTENDKNPCFYLDILVMAPKKTVPIAPKFILCFSSPSLAFLSGPHARRTRR